MTKEVIAFNVPCKGPTDSFSYEINASVTVYRSGSRIGAREVGCTHLRPEGKCVEGPNCIHLFPQSSEIKPIFINGVKIVKNEVRLFRFLEERCGEVVTKAEIAEAIGCTEEGAYVLLQRLRNKITTVGPAGSSKTIETIKGEGFRLVGLERISIIDNNNDCKAS
ncbi:MAG: hypothetical protein A2W22_04965 [Candidatus Levybacteria bacterium RBG_16_35_11]|nr:MAG: hypothetical protein A2W22_04965 [Candidatus Levybacteria bacterium RBG_16_35_11]